MSIEHWRAVWDRSPNKGSLLLAELAIADYANEEGIAWPSRKTLARRLRLSEAYIRDLIGKLAREGAIEILNTGGGHRSNRYRSRAIDRPNEPQGGGGGPPRGAGLPGVRASHQMGGGPPGGGEAGLPSDGRRASPDPSLTPHYNPPHPPPAAEAATSLDWDLGEILAINGIRKREPGPAGKFIGLYLHALTQSRITNPAHYAASRWREGKLSGVFKRIGELGPRDLAMVLEYAGGRADLFGELGPAEPIGLALRGLIPERDRAERIERAFHDLGLEHIPPEVRAPAEPGEPSPHDLFLARVRKAGIGSKSFQELIVSGRTEKISDRFVITFKPHLYAQLTGRLSGVVEDLRQFVAFDLKEDNHHESRKNGDLESTQH